MNQYIKTTIIITITAAITLGLSAYFLKPANKPSKLDFIEMQAFNDVNRLEDYDTLEQLLVNNCHNEALEFVKIQQQSLLSGINDYFLLGDTVRKVVKSRSSDIYERSIKSSRPTPYTKPMC